jgi:hypothetical protein
MADINSLLYVNRTFNSWQEVEYLLHRLKQDFFAPLCRKTTSIKAHNEKVHQIYTTYRSLMLCTSIVTGTKGW